MYDKRFRMGYQLNFEGYGVNYPIWPYRVLRIQWSWIKSKEQDKEWKRVKPIFLWWQIINERPQVLRTGIGKSGYAIRRPLQCLSIVLTKYKLEWILVEQRIGNNICHFGTSILWKNWIAPKSLVVDVWYLLWSSRSNINIHTREAEDT